MFLAHIDESGNTGPVAAGGSLTYTLGCVLIEADEWPQAFDRMIAFRRRVRDRFAVPMRSEARANDLIRASGAFRHLAPAERRLIYRAHMRELSNLGARAFAVVVDKRPKADGVDVFDLAWEGMLQRLERTSSYEDKTFMILHDDGENDRVRAWARRARRHLTAGGLMGSGHLTTPAHRLVDDPVPRNSQQSYFIQLADLVAYAAFRSVIAPGQSIAQVCPQSTWAEIGAATHTPVNRVARRAAPGIVLR
jgi:hypothetical protein